MKRLMITFGLLFAAAAMSGCAKARNFANGCEKEVDCPVGSDCKFTGGDLIGICVCRSDEACGPGEICNTQGVCQTRAGCRTTTDCVDEPNTFCDIGSGDCIPLTGCGSHVHCDSGFVCDPNTGACSPGCYGHGDCQLGATCSIADGQTLGTCLAGTCGDKSFCAYGDLCAAGSCTPHPNPNNCLPCGSAFEQCPSPRDFCLSNNQYDPNRPETGSSAFCSIECTSDDSCPNGYNCNGIVLPTQSDCTNSQQCGAGSQCVLGEAALRGWCTCIGDDECSPNEFPPTCQKSCSGLGIQACETDAECIGRCVAACLSPAGQSCTDDSQCQPTPLCENNRCVTNGAACGTGRDCLCNANGQCINSGRPCQQSSDCALTCQQGGCLLGRGCAPEEGLLCPQLTR